MSPIKQTLELQKLVAALRQSSNIFKFVAYGVKGDSQKNIFTTPVS